MLKIQHQYSPKTADEYGRRQANVYEQFLHSIESIIFGLRGSGVQITPRLLRKAEREFERRKAVAWESLTEIDLSFPFCFETDLNLSLFERREQFFNANKVTFLSALRFGNLNVTHIFEAHGGFGLLAQIKASEVKWTIRSKSGARLDACKAFYTEHRDFAYQALLDLIAETNPECKDFGVIFENPNMLVFQTDGIKAKDLADRNSERRKYLFHVGSNNWIA